MRLLVYWLIKASVIQAQTFPTDHALCSGLFSTTMQNTEYIENMVAWIQLDTFS